MLTADMAARMGLKSMDWIKVRKAGRKIFVMAAFSAYPETSMGELEQKRDKLTEEFKSIADNVDVVVLFGV